MGARRTLSVDPDATLTPVGVPTTLNCEGIPQPGVLKSLLVAGALAVVNAPLGNSVPPIDAVA